MSSPEQAEEAELLLAAQAWMAAAFRRDLEACAQVLSDDFTMVTDRGSQIDKTQWLANVQQRMSGEPPAFLDARVRLFGDVAVMTSRNEMRATFDGKDWNADLFLTDVWVRIDGHWRLVRRHASRVVPEAS